MPIRADVLAATPKCPRRERPDAPLCGKPLVARGGLLANGDGYWVCPEPGHGVVKFAEVVPPPLIVSSGP